MRILLVAFLLVLATCLTAQRLPILKPLGEAQTEQISLANPYIGVAKLAYNLDPDRPLDNNLIFSVGAQITPIKGDRYAIPILGVGSLGSDDILNPNSGLNIGIFPYYIASKSETLRVVLHGGLNYKTIVEGVEAGVDPLQQFKFLGGVEFIYAKSKEALPITLSVTPSYLYHTDIVENSGALELTAVVPIAQGLGLLAEGFAPFNRVLEGQFRFAVISVF